MVSNVERLEATRVERGRLDLAFDEVANGIAELELLRGQIEVVHDWLILRWGTRILLDRRWFRIWNYAGAKRVMGDE